MKQIIEPSAAVGLAVILNNPSFAEVVHACAMEQSRGNWPEDIAEVRIGVVWTGGNVELQTIARAVAEHGDRAH